MQAFVLAFLANDKTLACYHLKSQDKPHHPVPLGKVLKLLTTHWTSSPITPITVTPLYNSPPPPILPPSLNGITRCLQWPAPIASFNPVIKTAVNDKNLIWKALYKIMTGLTEWTSTKWLILRLPFHPLINITGNPWITQCYTVTMFLMQSFLETKSGKEIERYLFWNICQFHNISTEE